MRPDDFFVKPKPEKPKDVILFAGKNYIHFNDECFIITDGYPGLPHAGEAEKLTAETALWAYKVVRQRPFYWKEKLPFLKRIFRSTNLTLWQKRRDPGYDAGLASALMVLIVIDDYFWLGSAGNCNSFLFRDGLIDILTKRDVDDEGMLTKAVGFTRKQLLPTMHSEKLLEHDTILIATDSIADYVTEDEMRGVFDDAGTTQESLKSAIDKLGEIAKAAGSRDTMSVCIIKRIVV
jgi:serine/threonine protein phosphatase PrpC